MKILAGILLLCSLSCASAAEVYRCERDGKLTYTDQPCAAGAEPAQLPAINGVPAARGDAALAKQYDADEKREADERRTASRAWLKQHGDDEARRDAIRKGLIDGRVVKGMTPQEVERVLNLPLRIEDQGGPHERWIYQDGRSRRTVSFKDGVVSSVASHAARR